MSQRHKSLLESGSEVVLKVGLPWTCIDFVKLAQEVEHPLLSTSLATCTDNLRAIFNVLTRGPEETRKKRSDF